MAITPVPPLSDVPDFPALSDRAAGTYNSKAYAFGAHMANTFNAEIAALAGNVYSNAQAAETAASTAVGARDDAAVLANAAAQSVVAAAEQADSAAASVTAAQAAAAAAGAAAGLPALAGAAMQFLRVKSDETGVEFAAVEVPPQLVQKRGVFADGASALTPVSSGEVILDTAAITGTGLGATVRSVAYSNGLFIATGAATGVATATSAAGPWTLRSFAASLDGTAPTIGTDGTNSIVFGGGNPAVARSTNGTTWTRGTNLPGNPLTGVAPVCIGGVWLIASSTVNQIYRSANHGTSWTTEGITRSSTDTIFRLGSRFAYFYSTNIYHSALGTAGAFVGESTGLGFTPSNITPFTDGTCAFTEQSSGQVWIATAYNVFTKQHGVFCPANHKILRINGVWLFYPIGLGSFGAVQTATPTGMVPRWWAYVPYLSAPDPALICATADGITVLPGGNFGVNGRVTVVSHSASRQVYFGV